MKTIVLSRFLRARVAAMAVAAEAKRPVYVNYDDWHYAHSRTINGVVRDRELKFIGGLTST